MMRTRGRSNFTEVNLRQPLYVLAILRLLGSGYVTFKVLQAERARCHDETGKPALAEHGRSLIFVFRLFKEQERVQALIAEARRLIASSRSHHVVFACSSFEQSQQSAKDTATALEEAIAAALRPHERDRVLVTRAPGRAGTARQTNHAVRVALQQFEAVVSDATWIKTMDADTLLSDVVLKDLHQAIEAGYPAIEVPASYAGNFASLGLIQRWHAVYQDRWSIAFEQARGLVKNRVPLVYSGISGAGGCIRADILERIDGFPEDPSLDDLTISAALNASKIPIYTTLSRLESDVPRHVRAGLKQEYEWSQGAIDVPLYLMKNRLPDNLGGTRGAHRVAYLSALGYSLWADMIWTLYSPAILFACRDAVQGQRKAAALYVTMLASQYVVHADYLNRRAGIAGKQRFLTALATPIQLARVSLPFHAALLARLSRARRYGRQRVYKTQH